MRLPHFVAGLVGVTVPSSDQAQLAKLEQSLPACSTSCLSQAAITYGCDTSDIACRCEKGIQMMSTVDSCLQRSCSADQKTSESQRSFTRSQAITNPESRRGPRQTDLQHPAQAACPVQEGLGW